MENKMATLLGNSFSTNENVVSQCGNKALGSYAEQMVITFIQEKFEEFISHGGQNPSSLRKHRKVYLAKTPKDMNPISGKTLQAIAKPSQLTAEVKSSFGASILVSNRANEASEPNKGSLSEISGGSERSTSGGAKKVWRFKKTGFPNTSGGSNIDVSIGAKKVFKSKEVQPSSASGGSGGDASGDTQKTLFGSHHLIPSDSHLPLDGGSTPISSGGSPLSQSGGCYPMTSSGTDIVLAPRKLTLPRASGSSYQAPSGGTNTALPPEISFTNKMFVKLGALEVGVPSNSTKFLASIEANKHSVGDGQEKANTAKKQKRTKSRVVASSGSKPLISSKAQFRAKNLGLASSTTQELKPSSKGVWSRLGSPEFNQTPDLREHLNSKWKLYFNEVPDIPLPQNKQGGCRLVTIHSKQYCLGMTSVTPHHCSSIPAPQRQSAFDRLSSASNRRKSLKKKSHEAPEHSAATTNMTGRGKQQNQRRRRSG